MLSRPWATPELTSVGRLPMHSVPHTDRIALDGRWRFQLLHTPEEELAANWDEVGITPDKWLAFYCGTGWRASETWFCAYLMGWQTVAVYDGGWWEWSQDPDANPIEAGEPVPAVV